MLYHILISEVTCNNLNCRFSLNEIQEPAIEENTFLLMISFKATVAIKILFKPHTIDSMGTNCDGDHEESEKQTRSGWILESFFLAAIFGTYQLKERICVNYL